jgi:hypothetical protein
MQSHKSCLNTNCGNFITGAKKKNNKYCSSSCSAEHRSNQHIQKWIDGIWDGSMVNGELSPSIRKFLLAEAKYKCSECGWDKINPTTGVVPLEVDHVDGVSTNNERNNLKVLCPNCHSLTPTYKSLNKTGRAWRKNYNQFELKGRKPLKVHPLCQCGNNKEPKAKTCRKCFDEFQKTKTTYPSISEILFQIENMGVSSYAKTLGISDNGLRAYLKRNGITEIPKKKPLYLGTACHCGVVLSTEDAKAGRKRCPEHRPVEFTYPPVEEILAGIEKLGMTGYARKIGVPYASMLRKHLARRGITVTKSNSQ